MNAEEAEVQGIEDMASLESAMPGLAQAVKTFFTVYKVFLSLCLSVSYIPPVLQVPAGDGENKFAYDGEIQEKKLAEDVVMWAETIFHIDVNINHSIL